MGASLTYHERIGSGSSGTVYRCTWKSKEFGIIEAAAKQIKLDGEITEKQKREIEFVKKLDHKNIIRYYDAVIEREHVVIVTEFAAKGSLCDYLKDKDKLPENLLHSWIYQLACGVNYLNQNKVAHCDLKSPNCIIMADDVIKICDFGIARYLTSSKTTRSANKGSVQWQAPEIFEKQVLSPKAAIYAFGIIVWEMVSCEEPYKDFLPVRVIYQVVAHRLRPTIADDCPQFLKELMEQCWHEDRTERPESSDIVRRVWREYKPTLPDADDEPNEVDGLEWQLKHEIYSQGQLQFLASDRLAIITRLRSVKVYHVSREEAHLIYTLTSDEWRGGDLTGDVYPWDVAVSESMPNSIFVIAYTSSYVYEFPCHEASNHVKKYQIHDGNVWPVCIAANANTAVIGLVDKDTLVVCQLPGFTQQRVLDLSNGLHPWDLTISTDYLVVMGRYEMVIKPMGDIGQDMCSIKPPDGWAFQAVSYRNDARQLYVACYHKANGKGCVYKYTWEGNGTPEYHNTGCVIDDLGEVWDGQLSVTSGGALCVSMGTHFYAVVEQSPHQGTQIFVLE
ncbi:uncharacterized protein [Amphiura filiformis]|uniref:uncharacterized protein n=1 Tax=Amphiura filiformis TaxID=82378 RepID=UPI003B21E627